MGAAPSINDISEKEFELFKHLKQEYEQKVKELNASEAQAGAEVTHPGSWLQAGNQQVIDDLTAKLRATEAELQNERAGGSGGGGGGDGGGGVPAPPRSSSPQWNESDTAEQTEHRMALVLRSFALLPADSSVEDVGALVASQACTAVEADGCAVYFSSKEDREWKTNPLVVVANTLRSPPSHKAALEVYESAATLVLDGADPKAAEYFEDNDEGQPVYRSWCYLLVPIVGDGGEVVGVVEAKRRRASLNVDGTAGFTDGDASRLVAVLSPARVVLEQVQSREATVERFKEENHVLLQEKELVESLLEVVKVISQGGKLTDLLDNIIMHIGTILPVDRISIFIVDEKSQELWCKIAANHSGFRVPLIKNSIAGWVAITRETLNIEDAYTDTRFNPAYDRKSGYRTQSILCMPIVDRGDKVVGVVQVINKVADASSELELMGGGGEGTFGGGGGGEMSLSGAVALGGNGVPPGSEYESFTLHDEELLATVCEELGSVINVATLEAQHAMAKEQNKMDKNLHSLLANFQDPTANAWEDKGGAGGKDGPGGAGGPGGRGGRGGKGKGKLMRWPSSCKTDTQLRHSILNDWGFNVLDQEAPDLLNHVQDMFIEYSLLSHFKMDVDKFHRFICEVQAGYKDNPYHNFYHAFSVLHIGYLVLQKTSVTQYLHHTDLLGLFIGCICHDIGHPGWNNAYEVNSRGGIALRYNDASVLENMHAATTFQIMQGDETNVLSHLNPAEYAEVRKVVIHGILATDMAGHFDLVKKLRLRHSEHQSSAPAADAKGGGGVALSKAAVRRASAVPGAAAAGAGRRSSTFFVDIAQKSACPLSRDSKEDRALLVETMIHLCDLSNPVTPFHICSKWADLVVLEFFEQSIKEKALGLVSQPFMQKDPSDVIAKATLQVNFIDYVVQPLWGIVAEFFPKLKDRVKAMNDNRSIWEERKNAGAADAAAAGDGDAAKVEDAAEGKAAEGKAEVKEE